MPNREYNVTPLLISTGGVYFKTTPTNVATATKPGTVGQPFGVQ